MPLDLGLDPGPDAGLDMGDEPEVTTPAKNWKAHESEIIRAIRDQLGHPGDDQRGEVSIMGAKVVSTYGSSDLGYQIKGSFRAKFPVPGPGPYWFVANISPDDVLLFPVIITANDGNPIREAQVKQIKTAATDVPHLFAATVKPLENLYRFWTAVLKEAKSHEPDSSTSVCISSEPGEYSMFSADWMERGLQQTIEMFHGLLTLWKSSTGAVKAMPVAYAYYNQLAGIREAVVDLSEHALDHQVGFFCIDQRGVRALLTLITQARRDAMDLAKYLPLKMAPQRKQAAASPWRRLS
jgi:hypothetical protein